MDPTQRYRLQRGFSYRREAFGGILYHYEGTQPDPRVTIVSSSFLIDLLDVLCEHPDQPLGGLIEAVSEHCGLNAAQQGKVEEFLGTLTRRGALVPST